MGKYRVAVGEMHPELRPQTEAWENLCRDIDRASPDLFVLNEIPFGPWISARPDFDAEVWKSSIEAHEEGVAALSELGVPWVLGSRSVEIGGRRCNEGFVWSPSVGVQGVHTKQHIPDAPGYRETTWYEPGERHFNIVQLGEVRVGFLICTEIMFNEHARHYGRMGADLIVVPRAMPLAATHLFDVALQMSAVASGCYVASSNRGGIDSTGEAFEGRGCVVDPGGRTVMQTSSFNPLVCYDIDTDFVRWKQSFYPCDVAD